MGGALRIAAVVVLYNPAQEHLGNIGHYSDSVDRVYAIDNSEGPNPDTAAQLEAIPAVVYLPNHGNLGIAAALNAGAERAIADGYDLLLTMDQDSTATPGMVAALVSCFERVGREEIGIVSPCHQLGEACKQHPGDCIEIEVAMASGNLLNLHAFRAIGPFRDDYFIDYVDHEYCLRLRQHGFRIIQANKAVLRHRLGSMTWHRLLHKQIKLGNHSPLRRYYAFRNRFHLYQQYSKAFPVYFRYFYREIFQEIGALLLFEAQKLEKLRMMLRGYLDYRRGIFGKYRGKA